MHFKPLGNPQVVGSHHQVQRQVCDRPSGRERMAPIQTVYKGNRHAQQYLIRRRT